MFKVPLNYDIKLARAKGGKKKWNSRESGEVFLSTKELGLKDSAPFVLLEYSVSFEIAQLCSVLDHSHIKEEYPPLLNDLEWLLSFIGIVAKQRMRISKFLM